MIKGLYEAHLPVIVAIRVRKNTICTASCLPKFGLSHVPSSRYRASDCSDRGFTTAYGTTTSST